MPGTKTRTFYQPPHRRKATRPAEIKIPKPRDKKDDCNSSDSESSDSDSLIATASPVKIQVHPSLQQEFSKLLEERCSSPESSEESPKKPRRKNKKKSSNRNTYDDEDIRQRVTDMLETLNQHDIKPGHDLYDVKALHTLILSNFDLLTKTNSKSINSHNETTLESLFLYLSSFSLLFEYSSDCDQGINEGLLDANTTATRENLSPGRQPQTLFSLRKNLSDFIQSEKIQSYLCTEYYDLLSLINNLTELNKPQSISKNEYSMLIKRWNLLVNKIGKIIEANGKSTEIIDCNEATNLLTESGRLLTEHHTLLTERSITLACKLAIYNGELSESADNDEYIPEEQRRKYLKLEKQTEKAKEQSVLAHYCLNFVEQITLGIAKISFKHTDEIQDVTESCSM